MIASTLSIALLAALNDRPTHDEIMSWIDVETILLLFSMMILVGILTETGVFDHLAVYAYRVSGQVETRYTTRLIADLIRLPTDRSGRSSTLCASSPA